MKIDVSKSKYHEAATVEADFDRDELRKLRLILRRLRFLEQQARENEDMNRADNGGAMFVLWEVDALEWILTEVGFLPDTEPARGARQ